MSKKIWNDIQNKELKADKTIENLIEKSIVIESDKYIEKAILRHRFGRPPGKNSKSYGDEINWEAILEEVGNDGEFIIISKDGDYSGFINEDELKDYLTDEWKNKHKNKIYFYKKLSTFFKEHDLKIELQIEKEKDNLIEKLINSGNFLITHEIISRLNKYESFSDDQIRGMVTALIDNSQINWSIEDEDVDDFYKKHLANKFDLFNDERWKEISNIIFRNESNKETDEKIGEIENAIRNKDNAKEEKLNIEDIPF